MPTKERGQKAAISLASVLAMLGPEATEADAKQVQSIIEHGFPGISINHIPEETWTWVRTGHGQPPRAVALPANTTGLMDMYESMSDTKRAERIGIAYVLNASEKSTSYSATTQAAILG